MASRSCAHCGRPRNQLPFLEAEGVIFWYCSRECQHAAGDRSACQGSQYSKKRRLLREHRWEMRTMGALLAEHGLLDEMDDRVLEATGNTGFWLGLDDGPGGMDETSDNEDPEAEAIARADALQQESVDRQGFLTAVAGALECRSLATDLERARMRLEDVRV